MSIPNSNFYSILFYSFLYYSRRVPLAISRSFARWKTKVGWAAYPFSSAVGWEKAPLELALRSELAKNEELVAEREYLVQLLELRNEQWARRVSVLESRIEQMKVQEVSMQKYNATKLEFLVDTKETKALSFKEYAELAEKDLEDAYTCIAALGAEINALKSKLNKADAIPIGACDNSEMKDLKLEIRKLKHGYKTLKSEKEAQLREKENQIDALTAEKDFVWNQYRILESDFVELKLKNSELDKCNEEANMLKKNWT